MIVFIWKYNQEVLCGHCMNCLHDQLFRAVPLVLAVSSTVSKFLNFEIGKSPFLWLTTRIWGGTSSILKSRASLCVSHRQSLEPELRLSSLASLQHCGQEPGTARPAWWPGAGHSQASWHFWPCRLGLNISHGVSVGLSSLFLGILQDSMVCVYVCDSAMSNSLP